MDARLLRQGLAATALVLSCGISGTAHASTRCADLTPPPAAAPGGKLRPITPNDLVRLRDIGMPGYSVPGETPLAVSPDHTRVAFVLRRADPTTNSYCQGLYVVDIGGEHRVRQIDAGGEFISYVINDLRGLVNPSGTPAIITPAWSPDGRWIAYLKRVRGVSQIWLVRADGSQAFDLTHLKVDAESVTWSEDGKHLVFSSRPELAARLKQIDEEGLSGYRQNWQVIPAGGPKPFPTAPAPFDYFSIDVASGVVRPASPDERARALSRGEPQRPAGATSYAQAAGASAWVAPRYPKLYLSPTELWTRNRDSHAEKCGYQTCDDHLVGVWLSPDGHEVRYLRRDGWANSRLSLYRWRPGTAPVKVFSTDDVLRNCEAVGSLLLCTRESSLKPIRIVTIDPVTGQSSLVFDPNPEFAGIKLGTAQRLHWRNRFGVECFGDLVLPTNFQRGRHYPLIITQYRTSGFLRGATGDQYPIQSFAADGFAVLSLDRPEGWAQAHAKPGDQRTFEQFDKENYKNWIDRRNDLSWLLTGLKKVEAMGIVDPHRVGITGTSEGAEGVWFALNNTRDLFAAASFGSCCMDPKTLLAFGGEAWAKTLQEIGFPPYGSVDPTFWKPISLAMNVDHIRIPLLIQVPDAEYALGLETYTTYRERGRPIEFYVFPHEYHAIWQPAHRLAMYKRNLAFFDHWLKPPSSIRSSLPAPGPCLGAAQCKGAAVSGAADGAVAKE
jgi:dipeptidyl aminopeptidase/acylaminoacyl peptidase